MSDNQIDLSRIPAETIPELHRQAEACLNGTVQLATAADARATTLAGVFGGGSVALLAAFATIIAGGNTEFRFLLPPTFIAAASLFAASTLCAWAGRPSDFHIGGYEPRLLQRSATDQTWMLRYATEDIQDRIDANRAALLRNAKFLQAGMVIAILGTITSVVVFGFTA